MTQEPLAPGGADPTMPTQTTTKKADKPVVTSPDGLLGPCQSSVPLTESGKRTCGKQGALREVAGHLTTGRVLLCDRHAKLFTDQGFKLRTIKAGELPGV